MSILINDEIEYPYTVSVRRPKMSFDEYGNFEESFKTVIASMTADIQLSLKIRRLMNEDKTGSTESTVWLMFCVPPKSIMEGDKVSDGIRTFIVDAVGEWGSHTECIMKKV